VIANAVQEENNPIPCPRLYLIGSPLLILEFTVEYSLSTILSQLDAINSPSLPNFVHKHERILACNSLGILSVAADRSIE
jgi:hypothetical protein